MLFRTVYGQELALIHQFLTQQRRGVSKDAVCVNFIAASHQEEPSAQQIEDALSFLVSSHLINERRGTFTSKPITLPFRLALLENLRKLQTGTLKARHPLDPFYLDIFQQVFITPDITFVDDLHARANAVKTVSQAGGVSKEKVQSWKRVMEFLGMGYRTQTGFIAVLSPQLVSDILAVMPDMTMTLQDFFERTVDRFLPYITLQGDAAQSIAVPLLYAVNTGAVTLHPLQDSPSKVYMHPYNFRQISREVIHDPV